MRIITENLLFINKLLDQYKEVTGFDMIICIEYGEIVASTVKERIGNFHPGAKQIISGEFESLSISEEESEEKARQGLDIRAGWNQVIKYQGRPIGSIGVTGNTKLSEVLAKTISMSIPLFLDYVEKDKEKINRLQKFSDQIQVLINDTNATVHEFQREVKDLAKTENTVVDMAKKIEADLNNINQVTIFIKNIADKSRLLGINAAIEAAGAGEAGNGFAIVADEIREMAQKSKENVTQIEETLEKIKLGMPVVVHIMEQNSGVLTHQIEKMEEISKSMKSMIQLLEDVV